MGRDENLAVFQDTERQCKNNEKLVEVIKNSCEKQKLILEKENVSVPEARYNQPAQIIVSKKRTFEAAAGYKGEKVCVLNFASAGNPGGGVVNGATAQEEALCRCSTLYFNLNVQEMWDGFYKPHRAERNPLHNDDIIYTPDVTVFKSDTANPKLLPENDWYSVNVITCAAPNLREMPGNRFNSGDGDLQVKISDEDLLKVQEKRLRKILSVASANGNDVVILGAFGCGVFKNPPRIVAQAAKNVIKEFANHFKTIEFAVYCPPTDDRNYVAFRNVLEVTYMSTSIFKTTQNTRMLIKGSARYIRSDIPEKLTRGEIEWLLSNNVKTVVDLRSERECKKTSCCLINEPGFNYINLPVSNGNAIPAKPSLVASSYLDMIDEKMFEIIKTIENSEDNVLFFCTAGKDRTGVVSALLLKRMGVSDDEIVADYLESADNLRAKLDAYASEHPDVDIEVITPKAAYMRGFLELCDEKWGWG